MGSPALRSQTGRYGVNGEQGGGLGPTPTCPEEAKDSPALTRTLSVFLRGDEGL